MGFLFQKRSAKGETADCGQLVMDCQKGDSMARERLIKDYTPFILKTTSKVSGRYVRMGEDDEVSIGLIAFNEAIDCFDINKNHSFLSFAETVIKRRLIDYFRKETNTVKKTIPLSTFEQDEESGQESNLYYIEAKQSIEVFQDKNAAAERKEEILIYTKKINEFGISFQDLIDVSPKHEDARIRAMETARLIADDKEMVQHLLRKKELPLKLLEQKSDLSRKTLERQRKYIIAVTLILVNDFEHLKEYIFKA